MRSPIFPKQPRCARKRVRSGLCGNHPGAFRSDPSHRFEFLEGFPHSDESDAAARGIDDHVRQRTVELLPQFVPHRFLSFDPVRLLERGDLEPCFFTSDAMKTPQSEINPSISRTSAPNARDSRTIAAGVSDGMAITQRIAA
jgi:hypothetical protein